MAKKSRINECGHPDRKHQAKGMCSTCYDQYRRLDPSHVEKSRAYKRQYYIDHREEHLRKCKEYTSSEHGSKIKQAAADKRREAGYYRTDKHKEASRERKRKYRSEGNGRQKDKEYKKKPIYKEYLRSEDYLALKISRHRVRKALKLEASLGGIFKYEIASMYKNKGEGMHVDHIIPLNHSDICGLHVPWNLQYLTVGENLCKSNKFDGTYENESWRVDLETR